MRISLTSKQFGLFRGTTQRSRFGGNVNRFLIYRQYDLISIAILWLSVPSCFHFKFVVLLFGWLRVKSVGGEWGEKECTWQWGRVSNEKVPHCKSITAEKLRRGNYARWGRNRTRVRQSNPGATLPNQCMKRPRHATRRREGGKEHQRWTSRSGLQ